MGGGATLFGGFAAGYFLALGLIAEFSLVCLLLSAAVIAAWKNGIVCSNRNDGFTNGEPSEFEQEIQRQRRELQFAELALGEKEREIHEMFERLDAAKLYTKNASRLHDAASRRFEELFHGIPIACFTCDLDGVIFDCSQSAESLWGVESSVALHKTIFELMGTNQNRSQLEQLVALAKSGESVERVEFEIRTRNEEDRWVLASLFPLAGLDGGITGSVWSVVDETDRKRQADYLIESETRFRISLDAMQSGVMIFDSRGRLKVTNPRATEILGWDVQSLMAAPDWFEKLRPIDRNGVLLGVRDLPLYKSLSKNETSRDLTLGILRHDDQIVWISANSAPLVGHGGVGGAVVTFVDISQQLANEKTIENSMDQIRHGNALLEEQKKALAEANRRLEELAATDGLTGLKNQRHYHEMLESHFRNATRYDYALSLLILDVDFFKAFNDEFGHPAGDEVLAQVAKILTREARAGDFVSRCGGEEFAIVLPNTDAKSAVDAADRIRLAIEGAEWRHRPITVSVGVASRQQSMSFKQELIQLADQALYRSKDRGRNCVTLSDERGRAA